MRFELSKDNVERNKTLLHLPFRDEWFVFWGGNTKRQNIHHDTSNQRFAFDFCIVDGNNKTYKGNGDRNEDYYCFEGKVLAPADGIVTDVINGVRDNKPGSMNSYSAMGNAVVIEHNKNEFSALAHFKNGSIKVKVGEAIKTGQVIGLCGNSGNSSEPHLHYHLQNNRIMQEAIGVKCFFENVVVRENSKEIYKVKYSPLKGEFIHSEDS